MRPLEDMTAPMGAEKIRVGNEESFPPLFFTRGSDWSGALLESPTEKPGADQPGSKEQQRPRLGDQGRA